MSETSTFARRIRAARPRARRHDIRDDVVPGLALRLYPSGTCTFTLASMVRGRRRYATIGDADAMTVPEARREARRLIANYTEPAVRHDGPRSPGHPMAAFAGEFLDRQAPRWKPKTLKTNAGIMRRDILPTFGGMTVDAVTAEHVRDWFASMSTRPGIANRAMPVLSMMMKMAELWGYRAHNSNPCRNTRRYRMKPMERFLTADEMARLNAVLTRQEFRCPDVVAIVRLLMLTGCRFSEVAALEWDWIKGERIHLPDSKSGPRTVWLSSAARSVIDAIPRYREDCPYLFPSVPPTRPVANIAKQWKRIRDEAELPGLRLHDLRHSFASTAAMHGVDMVTIAKLLGHALVETTERYVHLSDQSVTDAADRVSGRIHAALAGRGTEYEGGSDHARR
ncbi:MAG: tyrosine-type recombinase/integrase [Rhodospirillales bacterium]|nr:tyrosine-type recombinase/integrase [Rhodospirillales bacterium]